MATYKGYTADIKVSEKEKLLSGRVLDIKDTITFYGETVEEAIQEFEKSVDAYLKFCEEMGQKPDKPFSGKLPFRTTPEVHKAIYLASTKDGKSINAWMESILKKALTVRRASYSSVSVLIEKQENLEAFLKRVSKFLIDTDPLTKENFIDALEKLLIGLEEVTPFIQDGASADTLPALVREIQVFLGAGEVSPLSRPLEEASPSRSSQIEQNADGSFVYKNR